MIDLINLFLLLLLLGMVTVSYKQRITTKTRARHEEIILDTCALIDGRIVDLVRSGFVRSQLVVPRTVVAELQHLADHGDAHKRERARYGLDVIKQLQELSAVVILGPTSHSKPVDEQLVLLAKQRHAPLYTTDFNLNKVAKIEEVTVLNINELSQYIRPHVLPGETKEIKIIDKGETKQQGVGYLPDGTMVVVDGAYNKIGKTIHVEFNRMLQTQAGRMMFATPIKRVHHPKRTQER